MFLVYAFWAALHWGAFLHCIAWHNEEYIHMSLTGNIQQIDHNVVEFNLGLDGDSLGRVEVSSNVPLRANPTALIPAFLPIAARLGHDLHIEGEVDEEAAGHAVAAIGTLADWDSSMDRARLVDVQTDKAATVAGGVACLASLGLDSFYSIHTRHDDVTHLVLCRGLILTSTTISYGIALWKLSRMWRRPRVNSSSK